MAYSAAIFYVDDGLASGTPGSDSTRPTLSAVVFSNPSADVVRGTFALHGLVTGAVIDVTGTTNGDGAYKITVVDVNTFDLDGASWASFNGADVIGDVVPRGGSSWADAWATISSGATAARIQAGDTIRVAKSPAPTSLGNATWNHNSKTVTLASAQTQLVDDCETAWTAANSATVTRTTTGNKSGTYRVNVTKSSYATSTKYAYRATGTLDLSSYQKLSFWWWQESSVAANKWKICLCSDTAGNTIVDTFLIPADSSSGTFRQLTLTRVGGGNLGSSIQSIALYSDTSAPTANQDVGFDNFNACTTSGLNLQSLISKNSGEPCDSGETWFGIQSINGTTVLLDNGPSTEGEGGRGYHGTTETVTTYYRETIKLGPIASATTDVVNTNAAGSAGSPITYEGGWTPGGSRSGETIYDGVNGNGNGWHVGHNGINILGFSCVRFSTGVQFDACTDVDADFGLANSNDNEGVSFGSLPARINLDIWSACNNGGFTNNGGIYLASGLHGIVITAELVCNNLNYGFQYGGTSYPGILATITKANNNAIAGIYTGDRNVIDLTETKDNGSYGIYFAQTGGNNRIRGATTSGNGVSGVRCDTDNVLEDCSIGESTEWSAASTDRRLGTLYSLNHDTSGYTRAFFVGGTIDEQATDRSGGSGPMREINLTSSMNAPPNGYDDLLAEIAVAANKQVTVKAWLKKDHATNIDGLLICPGGQIAGVANDVYTYLADNTNWQELTIQFTPTEAGVVRVYVRAEWIASSASVYVDGISEISQAA